MSYGSGGPSVGGGGGIVAGIGGGVAGAGSLASTGFEASGYALLAAVLLLGGVVLFRIASHRANKVTVPDSGS